MKFSRGPEGGVSVMRLVPLWEETLESLLTVFTMGGHSEKVAVCKPARGLSPATQSPDHLDLGSPILQNYENINFLCLNYLFCGILLGQPKQTRELPAPVPEGVGCCSKCGKKRSKTKGRGGDCGSAESFWPILLVSSHLILTACFHRKSPESRTLGFSRKASNRSV